MALQLQLQPISSLHFQFFQPLIQTKTNAIFKFALSCSNETTQVQINVVKKKKNNNSRPSFTDQIRDKWSLKLASQREKFPWQEPEEQQQEPELEEQPQPQSQEDVSSTMLNFEFPKRLSPWHVAENSKNPQNVSEFDASEDNEENKKPLQKNSGGSVMEREVQESESSLKKRRSNTELAERLIPEHELRRLRSIALRMVERFSVGVAGITQELVDSIHKKWVVNEVVKFKFDSPLSANMKRAHQILESKTGGIVVWRSGSSIVLYRGMTYKLPCVESYKKVYDAQKKNDVDHSMHVVSGSNAQVSVKETDRPIESFNQDSAEYLKDKSEEEKMELIELNILLDELGPRFKDWTGCEPLPVDADQLPAVVQGYKTPFRLLPYGVKACLSNKETTVMRRIARRTAPHFALGRNRELQGLARAIVKLWETSAIAKIAIKRGVPFASNDRMAEVLKKLTGGTLLSRNKEYIVFYRGNDFLPPVVTKTLTERQKLTVIQQDEEEKARQSAASSITISNSKSSQMPLLAGTLAETRAATANWGHQPCKQEVEKMMRESTLGRFSSLIRNHENKLALAKARFRKAERDLVKIQGGFNAADLPTDLETLTNEERILFRKMGLSMKPYLLLGRRDVYAGTIENMHLHWKYRELVKILVKGKNLAQVKHIAISLEAESGGVLVSVDKDTKGHIIIIYRGKNYFRPQVIRPKSLLTRRQALARSMELQRLEALKHHISDLQEMIDLLKSELDDKKNEKVIDGDKTMYSTLDNNDVSSDDDMEDLNTLSP
ncbi:CRM-domain containing factor CFM3, chloroplastic/mitochondrial [Trifolium pratense]|uniref:CRM-domain containing factor CFM3, chloroplastic/mitochondrial n=1 Tax=Trifolium pratense TaxID=57577 RepID=UPI001E6931D9|nr:CRM-domain containing factor CFM3, chloroplastic/mitochondrial [Trifolium pratense]